MGKVKLYFNVSGLLQSTEALRHYFVKSPSIALPFTRRFVYICVTESVTNVHILSPNNSGFYASRIHE